MQQQVTLEQAMQVALRHHNAGRLAEAEKIYRQILAAQPTHADALHSLGIIAHQVGRHDAAIDLMRRAIAIQPDVASFHSNLAQAYGVSGRLDEAAAALTQAIRLNPGSAEAYQSLGAVCASQGKHDDAIAAYSRAVQLKNGNASAYFLIGNSEKERGRLDRAANAYMEAIRAKPDYVEAFSNLGTALTALGKYDDAIAALTRAIEITPAMAEAHNNLGNVLKRRQRFDDAVAAYRRAIEIAPGYPEPYSNLGNILSDEGKLEDAVAAYARAIELRPNFAEAYNNLGNALRKLSRLDDAVAALTNAVQFKPDYADAWNNLGTVLLEQDKPGDAVAACSKAIKLRSDFKEAHALLGAAFRSAVGKFDEGLEACTHALKLDPGLPDAHVTMGIILYHLSRYDEALDAFARALALKPDLAEAVFNMANALKELGRLNEADAAYQRVLALNPDDQRYSSNRLYALQFNPEYDAASIITEHRQWNRRHAAAFHHRSDPRLNDPAPDRRLRIGYVGADFREHCQTHFVAPLLSHHDHANFEIFCYSNVANPDDVTDRLRAYADAWRIIRRMSDDQAAELIRQDKIDILVDLTLRMADNRLLLFARKPAPVQMTWLGYPGTTGLDAIDYRLGDPYLDPPENDAFYSEATLRLRDTFWCYDPLTTEPPVNELPALKNGFVTFGFLNNFFKVSDRALRLWAEVLRAIPGSQLLILAPRGSGRRRVLDFFRQAHIDPARIDFSTLLPMAQYLELYHRVDVGLDALPYNGHTCSLDSFWMGVPVVTLVGKTVVGRAGLSQLTNLGMTELVAWDPEQYVRIVQQLTGDLPKLAALRAGLRERMTQSPLMDAPRFARNIEAAYREAWQRWCLSRA